MSSDSNIPVFKSPLPIDLFLKSSTNTYVYDDLRQFEHAFLGYLKEMEYDVDKPVALEASSSDEMVFIIASCWRLGIPFIPLDPELPDKEGKRLFQQLNIGLLIGDQNMDSSNLSFKSVPVDHFELSKRLNADFTPEEWVTEHKKTISPHQIFGYFLTSGTTGTPKVVPLKRRQMLYATKESAHNIRTNRNRFWLLSLPLNHIGGVSVIFRSLLYGSGIYRTDQFDISKTTELLSRNHRSEAASLVPTMLSRLIESPDFSVHDDFQAILLGGGPIAPDLIDKCFNRGIPVISSYGMTESCAQIAANPLMTVGDLSRPKESVGKIFRPNSIHIRDERGETVTTSKSGQIWIKGPQVFDGYHREDRSQYFDDNGWFNTGDYGYLNEQDELFIEARRTDLIISGGENISPTEVEDTLKELSNIQDAAVTGISDQEWGQKVVALVRTYDNQDMKKENIRQQLKEKMQSFKIPKEIIRVDHIPRTKTGKIKRTKVKEFFSK